VTTYLPECGAGVKVGSAPGFTKPAKQGGPCVGLTADGKVTMFELPDIREHVCDIRKRAQVRYDW
jgi:hypothetical protein